MVIPPAEGPSWTDVLTAIGTAVLAVFAIVTAWYARRAFLKQSREVAAIERQVADGQELARQQAELLKVQTGQLEVLRAQLEDQRVASAAQAEVLELQAAELRKSLEERAREARRRVREQAKLVFITESRSEGASRGPLDSAPHSILVTVVNSNQPVYEAEIFGDHGQQGTLGLILPGESVQRVWNYPISVDLSTCHAVLNFRDADGIWFMRQADGYLSDLEEPASSWSLNAAYLEEGG
jgi:hypothetical protein